MYTEIQSVNVKLSDHCDTLHGWSVNIQSVSRFSTSHTHSLKQHVSNQCGHSQVQYPASVSLN